MLEAYIPQANKPLTFISINIHIFQDNDGNNHYQYEDIPRIRQIIDWVNGVFAFNHTPSDTIICNDRGPLQQGIDTRIRFILNKIEFYRNSTLNISDNTNAFRNAMLQRDPLMDKQLNLFWSKKPAGWNDAAGFTTPPSTNMQQNQYIISWPFYNIVESDFGFALHLCHEIGHVLGLKHAYYGGGADAINDENSPFYLYDLHGCGANKLIPLTQGWGDPDPHIVDRDGKSNNLMEPFPGLWISTLQIALMHYSIKNLSVGKYEKYGNICTSKCVFGAKINRHKSEGNPLLIKYEFTTANLNWAWDGTYFTAPCDGVYSFSISFMKDSLVDNGTPNDVWINLHVDSEIVGSVWSEKADAKTAWSPQNNQFGRRDRVSLTTTLELKKGQLISTYIASENNELRHIVDLQFTGNLVGNKCGNCC